MQKRNKKEVIEDLLKLGNLTQEQIALEVNTKVAYVTKTKSILKKEGRLPKPVDSRPSSEASLPSAVNYAMDQMQEQMRQNVDTNNGNLNSLSEENLKILYFAFVSGLLPPAIIATTGLPPTLVEIEYGRYLRLKGQDISELQRNLFNLMVSRDFKDARLDELKKGQRSSDDLLSLIESFSIFQFKFGVQQSVDNRFLTLPEGWKRMICSRCGVPLEGLIIKTTELLGKAFENFLTASPEYSRRCTCYASLMKLAEYVVTIKQEKENAERIQRALNSIEDS